MDFINKSHYGGNNYLVAALIQRRRLQVLIHSRAYYVLSKSNISDRQFDIWALELKQLQSDYPAESQEVCFYEAFKDWDGTTGAFLPLEDSWVIKKTSTIYSIGGSENANKQTGLEHEKIQQKSREQSSKNIKRKKTTQQRGNSLF